MSWLSQGWQVFPAEPAVVDWVQAVAPVAMAMARDPAQQAAWLRHGGTWFAGVDMLANDADGAVPGGPPLAGAARDAAHAITGPLPLHRAQVSVTHPGYPGRDGTDTDAAHLYRLNRDAAHLDGLLPEGTLRRRHLREPHAYILGLPLTRAGAGAAPLVVYEGSHEVLRAALGTALADARPQDWPDIDVTDIYQSARKRCFDTCPRLEITACPGEAILLHRLTLHGIAPWADGATAAPEGRAIAYFRPVLQDIAEWLALP